MGDNLLHFGNPVRALLCGFLPSFLPGLSNERKLLTSFSFLSHGWRNYAHFGPKSRLNVLVFPPPIWIIRQKGKSTEHGFKTDDIDHFGNRRPPLHSFEPIPRPTRIATLVDGAHLLYAVN